MLFVHAVRSVTHRLCSPFPTVLCSVTTPLSLITRTVFCSCSALSESSPLFPISHGSLFSHHAFVTRPHCLCSLSALSDSSPLFPISYGSLFSNNAFVTHFPHCLCLYSALNDSLPLSPAVGCGRIIHRFHTLVGEANHCSIVHRE